jgi:hypothetical protein
MHRPTMGKRSLLYRRTWWSGRSKHTGWKNLSEGIFPARIYKASRCNMNVGLILDRALNRLTGRRSAPLVQFGPPRPTRLNMTEVFGGSILRRGMPIFPRRRSDPQWLERGWRQTTDGYRGFFRAAGRSWAGLIQEPYRGGYEAYIWHPPLREIDNNTSHRPCFMQPQRDGRYRVHFREMPATIDHAIKSIEDVLKEAYRTRI